MTPSKAKASPGKSWVADLKANLKKIPEWAEDEDTTRLAIPWKKRVENWTLQVLQDSTTELGETIDAYLENNKEKPSPNSPRMPRTKTLSIFLPTDCKAELVRFMDETEITNKGTLADQSRNVLIKLQLANRILKELAEKDAKDLNREQRQLRLAIALMMEGTKNLKLPGDGT